MPFYEPEVAVDTLAATDEEVGPPAKPKALPFEGALGEAQGAVREATTILAGDEYEPLNEEELVDFTTRYWQAEKLRKMPVVRELPRDRRPALTIGEILDEMSAERGVDATDFQFRFDVSNYPTEYAQEALRRDSTPDAPAWVAEVQKNQGVGQLGRVDTDTAIKSMVRNNEVFVVGDDSITSPGGMDDPYTAKPGTAADQAFTTLAGVLLNNKKTAMLVDKYSADEMGWSKFIDDETQNLMDAAGLHAGSPNYDEEKAKLRQVATKELVTLVHKGIWKGPVYMGLEDLTLGKHKSLRAWQDAAEVAWADSSYLDYAEAKMMGLWEATSPNVRVIGLTNSGAVAVRSEPHWMWFFRAADVAQSALAAQGMGEGALMAGGDSAEGIERGLSFIDTGAHRGGHRAQQAASLVTDDPYTQEVARKIGSTVGGVAGVVPTMLMPDLTVFLAPVLRPVKYGVKAMTAAFAMGRAGEVAKAVTATKAIHAAHVADDAAEAARLESEFRDVFPQAMAQVSRNDAAFARRLAAAGEGPEMMNPRWAPSHINEAAYPELRNKPQLHHSTEKTRRSVAGKGQGMAPESVGYDFDRKKQAVEARMADVAAGGDYQLNRKSARQFGGDTVEAELGVIFPQISKDKKLTREVDGLVSGNLPFNAADASRWVDRVFPTAAAADKQIAVTRIVRGAAVQWAARVAHAPEVLADLQKVVDAIDAQKKSRKMAFELTAHQLDNDVRVSVSAEQAGPEVEGPGFATILSEAMSSNFRDKFGESKIAADDIAEYMLGKGEREFATSNGTKVPMTADNIRAVMEQEGSVRLPRAYSNGRTVIDPRAMSTIQANLDARKSLDELSKPPLIPLHDVADATVETYTTTGWIDALLRTKEVKARVRGDKVKQDRERFKTAAAVARNILIGGDVGEKMFEMPEIVREYVDALVRPIEHMIGEGARLVREGNLGALYKYLGGEAGVRFKHGQAAYGAGIVDFTGAASRSMRNMIDALPLDDRIFVMRILSTSPGRSIVLPVLLKDLDENKRLFSILDRLATGRVQADGGIETVITNHKFFADMMSALGVNSKVRSHREVELMRAMLWSNAQGRSGAEAAEWLVTEITRIYGGPSGDIGPALRSSLVIIGYGASDDSMQRFLRIGLAIDEGAYSTLRAAVGGEFLSLGNEPRAQKLLDTFGVATSFIAAEHRGQRLYLPAQAEKILSDVLAKSGDPLLAAAKGIGAAKAESTALYGLVRMIKTSLVRGFLWTKQRFFTTSTIEVLTATTAFTNFQTGLQAVARIAGQNLLTLPAVANIIHAGEKGAKVAGVAGDNLPVVERLREALQAGGDKAARAISELGAHAPYSVSVNQILTGGPDDFIVFAGRTYSAAELRRIAIEEGVAATFANTQTANEIAAMFGIRHKTGGPMTPGLVDTILGAVKPHLPDSMVKLLEVELLSEIGQRTSDLAKFVDGVAESFDERLRFGIYATLLENGLNPKDAARMTRAIAMDYTHTASTYDKSLLLQLLFPFWAFQKNYNRQYINLIMSSEGAYRMGMARRYYEGTGDAVQNFVNEVTSDPLGVDPRVLDSQAQKLYYTMAAKLSEKHGSLSAVPEDVRAGLQILLSGNADHAVTDGELWKLDLTEPELAALAAQWRAMETENPELVAQFRRAIGPRTGDIATPDYAQGTVGVILPFDKFDTDSVAAIADKGDFVFGYVYLPSNEQRSAVRHMYGTVHSVGLLGAAAVGTAATAVSNLVMGAPLESDEPADLRPDPFEQARSSLEDTFPVMRAPLMSASIRFLGVTSASDADVVRVHPSIGSVSYLVAPQSVEIRVGPGGPDDKRYYMDKTAAEILLTLPGARDFYTVAKMADVTTGKAATAGFEWSMLLQAMGANIAEIEPSRTAEREMPKEIRKAKRLK